MGRSSSLGAPVSGILIQALSRPLGRHEDTGIGIAQCGEEVELAAGWLQEAEEVPVLLSPCQACSDNHNSLALA